METIIGIGGASSLTMLLVALFKKGYPSAPSKLIAFVSFLSGQATAVLVAMAGEGLSTNQKVLSVTAITGIMAAAAGAGISRTDQSAENDRVAVGAKEAPKENITNEPTKDA